MVIVHEDSDLLRALQDATGEGQGSARVLIPAAADDSRLRGSRLVSLVAVRAQCFASVGGLSVGGVGAQIAEVRASRIP